MAPYILALEKDLFFSVKMRDTMHHHGIEVKVVRTLPAFEQGLAATGGEKPVLVIINIAASSIDWQTAILQARANGYPVLAFGSHMDLEARAKALEAGAQKVVANSKFTSDMANLIQGMLINPGASSREEGE
jgi:DNA-binding response OmpR family regulator